MAGLVCEDAVNEALTVLEYYQYTVIGEYVEGMGGVVVTKEEFPDIYNELFALGKKLSEAIQANR